ncbi:MAG: hypothetical protein AAFY02_05930 [Pseudomonadota bacterium]
MSDVQRRRGWKLVSGQKSVPKTFGVGKHNYIMLVDPRGRVREEIHGHPTDWILGGPMGVTVEEVTYTDGVRDRLSVGGPGEEDRSTWVELPPIKGLTVEQTWKRLARTAAKYDRKYEYRVLPSGSPQRLGSTEQQFYESQPTYNSNSLWRTILEDNGYDFKLYHPKESLFSFSPGDGYRLGDDKPPRSGATLLTRPMETRR